MLTFLVFIQFDKYEVFDKVQNYVSSMKGNCVAPEQDRNALQNYSSKVTISCEQGHEWSASVNNLIFGNTWCKVRFICH